MSVYQIEIDDQAIVEQIRNIVAAIAENEIRARYGRSGSTADVISTFVKEVVYAHKDEIIEKVVDRASREIVKKGMPKFLNRLAGEDNGK